MSLGENLKSGPAAALKHLEVFGYCVLEGILSRVECARLETELNRIEAERACDVFSDEQRIILWNIHQSHSDIFLDKINVPQIMEIVRPVLTETVILNSFFGVRPQGNFSKINTHIDSRIPVRDFEYTIQMLAMFCITDFTLPNGSTCLWPHSHKSGLNPKEAYPSGTSLPGKIQCETKAGDVIVFLGQTWHDIGPNVTSAKRWALMAYYSRWWVKPSFDYTRCGQEVYSRLTPEQKTLFGFTSRPPTSAKLRIHTLTKVDSLPTSYGAALES